MVKNRFDEQVAVVLGGAQGIGAATVKRLAQEGAKVVIGDINTDEGEKLAASLGPDGALFHEADLADKDSLVSLIHAAEDRFGGLDCLANVAAVGHRGDRLDITQVDEDLIDLYMGVNAKGFMISCQQAIPLMLKRGGGSIVQVSSIAGQYGGAMSTMPLYGMCKAAVDSLSRHIAAAYGKQNIRCNSIAPGTTMTEMVRAHSHNIPDFDRTLESTPSSRFADPEDIASVICFLLSSDARHVNAQTVRIDGGESAVMFPAPGNF